MCLVRSSVEEEELVPNHAPDMSRHSIAIHFCTVFMETHALGNANGRCNRS